MTLKPSYYLIKVDRGYTLQTPLSLTELLNIVRMAEDRVFSYNRNLSHKEEEELLEKFIQLFKGPKEKLDKENSYVKLN